VVSIRRLTERDVGGVAALFERVYPQQRWSSRSECERYFREIFFANPWRHLDIPSWIAVEGGAVAGFAGVLPRQMMYGSRLLRVAVGCQFMIHPERRRSLIAMQLIQQALSGSQDLYLTDGSNDEARKLWLGTGGNVPLLQNLDWTRLLRPVRHALGLLEKASRLAPVFRAARAPGVLADALAARLHPNRFHRREQGLSVRPLDAAGLLTPLHELSGRGCALRPLYDRASLGWLLEQAARKTRHGSLRARAVFEGGEMLGWFIYYAQAGTVNEVLQVAAREDAFDRVLRRLLVDAWEQGATAVRGRVDPCHAQQLSDQHCWFRREGAWTLVYSRDEQIMGAIERGAATISRLDGEWWLRFHDR
jgi:hypothetical protein